MTCLTIALHSNNYCRTNQKNIMKFATLNIVRIFANNIQDMEEKKDVLILAIESSCDETAAAVVKNGREVLSNVISSQIALHTLYGGVVPEIASRKHIEKINYVIQEALDQAHVTLEDLDAIGVTYGPGGEGNCLCGKTAISWRSSY